MLLVLAARVAMEEADRDRFHAVGDQPTRSLLHGMTIDGTAYLAAPVGALVDGNTQLARHQWRGELDEQVVEVVAQLRARLEHVAEALGREERGLRAFPLDEGVGR